MKTSLDLMTDDDRRRQLVQASLRLWGRILAASLAILIFVGTAEWWQGRSTSRQRQALEHRYAPLETLKYDCIRMRGEIVALQKAQRLTQSLVETRPTLTLLGSIAAAAAQTSGHVYVSQLDLEQAESSAAPRTAVVMGLGQDGGAIAEFAAALRASELFAEVTLNSSDTSQTVDKPTQSFQIDCQF